MDMMMMTTKFDRNPQINSQDIEHKQNSDIDQGP